MDAAATRYRLGDAFTVADVAATGRLGGGEEGSTFAAGIGGRLGERVCCVAVPRVEVEVPTTIGLGDAFVGGFLAALTAEPTQIPG